MTDFVLTEIVATEVVEISSAVTTVTTTGETTSLVTTTETQVLVDTSQMTPTIISEGAQGPTGASGTGTAALVLEAGENLALGDPVYVSTNKLYKASHLNSNGVIGIITTASLLGFPATATLMGVVSMIGLTPGSTYFLSDGVLETSSPSSGNIVRMGKAISSNSLVLNIEEPVLLAA